MELTYFRMEALHGSNLPKIPSSRDDEGRVLQGARK